MCNGKGYSERRVMSALEDDTESCDQYLQQRENPRLLATSSSLISLSMPNIISSRFSWTLTTQNTSLKVIFLIFLCLTQSSGKLMADLPSPLYHPSLLSSAHSQHHTSTPTSRVSRSLGEDFDHVSAGPANPLSVSFNASLDTSSSSNTTTRTPESCEVSNIKCALRSGCGMALQKYMLDCADLINGYSEECELHCKDSLVILTSTPEGRSLMECTCSDQYCRDTKSRVEVCREEVVRARAHTGSYSCRLAHLVCTADTRCATAISYYDKFCKRMFSGRSCSARCNNSIAILQRQEKAARLETCECDGSEPFDCTTIKRNMARLCFHQVSEEDQQEREEETNEIDTSRLGDKSAAGLCRALDKLMMGVSFFMTLLFKRLLSSCV